jgi:hypothetical protein
MEVKIVLVIYKVFSENTENLSSFCVNIKLRWSQLWLHFLHISYIQTLHTFKKCVCMKIL